MQPEEEDKAAVWARIKKLELESEKRCQRREADTAHDEATLKSLMLRVVATAVAWITSLFVQDLVTLIVSGEHVAPGKGGVFLSNVFYTFVVCVACPPLMWALSQDGLMGTHGISFRADTLKLVDGCLPMIVMWAFMGVAQALSAWIDQPVWDELLMALVLVGFISGIEMTPCFRAAKAGVDAKGEENTIRNRYRTLPSFLTLAAGWCINAIMHDPIAALKEEVEDKPYLTFLIQLVYYIIAMNLIAWGTAWWSRKNSEKHPHLEDHEEKTGSVEAHALDMERHMGDTFIAAIGFVYAWALSDTLLDFVFPVLMGCRSSVTCSAPTNFLYAALLTVIFTWTATLYNRQDRKSALGKANQSLTITAMGLCIGWAWKGYFNMVIALTAVEAKLSITWCAFILLIAFWALSMICWHAFLVNKRRMKVYRMQSYNSTKVDLPVAQGKAEEVTDDDTSQSATKRAKPVQEAVTEDASPSEDNNL